ncbi:hypothetical protein V1522DRAFT_113321 [Lipomyces starkeyi]
MKIIAVLPIRWLMPVIYNCSISSRCIKSTMLDSHYFSRIPGVAAKSLYFCKEIIDRCFELRPVVYDCCTKVPCINFFRAYAKEQECPKCHEWRFQILGSTKKSTLRPRIPALFGQAELASRLLEYPTEVMNRSHDEPVAVMDF